MNKIILFLVVFFITSIASAQGVNLRQQRQIDAYYKSVLPGYVGGPTFAVPGYGGKFTGDMRVSRVGPAVTINRYPRRRVYYRPQVMPQPNAYWFGTPGYFVPFR